MILEKEGNYKLEDWKLTGIECDGFGWDPPRKPCHSVYTLEDGDIVKRKFCGDFYFGFICPNCHCFTQLLSETPIPNEIARFCLQVASPGSDEYCSLTDEEKELSKYL